MPKIVVPKESLEGQAPISDGIYAVRMDGFKPKLSSKKDSINLNAQLTVINDPELNDRRIRENLNTQAGWVMRDFCHAFGVALEGADANELPGAFQPPEEKDPTKWKYVGPLLGKTGKIEIGQQQTNKGNMRSVVKRYICAIPGCTENHSENLISS